MEGLYLELKRKALAKGESTGAPQGANSGGLESRMPIKFGVRGLSV